MANQQQCSALLTLPDLVTDHILHYLDHQSLLTLRLTSRQSKRWVDQAASHKLRVTLKSDDDVTLLLSFSNHPVSWEKFRFHWDSVFTRPKGLPKFLQQYGDTMTSFELTKCSVDDSVERNATIIAVLLACSNLRCLKICELSCPLLEKRHGLPLLQSNFRHSMRHLSIQRILCPEYKGLTIFQELLSSCDVLESLDPPVIALSSPDYLSFNYKHYFRQNIILPVLQWMEQHHLKNLFIQEYLFDTDPELLYYLAHVCSEKGTVLHPETFLPFSRSMFVIPETGLSVFQWLGRISGVNDLLLLAEEELVNLTFFSVSFRSFEVSERVLEGWDPRGSFKVPNLRSVEVEMTNSDPSGRPSRLSRFFSKFCGVERRAVEAVTVAGVCDTNCLLRAGEIVRAFPCLRKLEVANWDAGGFEFQILWGLVLLEEVVVRSCHRFGDEAVIGDDMSPKILQLKNLRVLTLSDVGPITDASYISVFRNLPLRRFYHQGSDHRVTIKGYLALTQQSCPFRNAISDLTIHASEFKRMDEYCGFLGRFPNLKGADFQSGIIAIRDDGVGGGVYQGDSRTCCAVV